MQLVSLLVAAAAGAVSAELGLGGGMRNADGCFEHLDPS